VRDPADRSLVILAYPRVEHEQDYLYHWMPFSLLTIAGALRTMPEIDVVIFDEPRPRSARARRAGNPRW
jgi:anaerobic magnesium-protoporphyrin IX monomethyl ester cyclase